MPLAEKELVRCEQCGTTLESGVSSLGCVNCLLLVGLGEPGVEGRRFQHYEVCRRGDGTLHELGRGAMGITYRALDVNLGSAVALKVISARYSNQPEARERFRREARAAAQLRHPNVASVFHFGETASGQCFYAMELIDGETLETRVRRDGPLPAAPALEIVTQVARALKAAESHKLVHRDLKPSNLMVLVNDSGSADSVVVKVIDFGLAKAVAALQSVSDLHAGFSGTPDFASPEQFNAAEVLLDARSDIYSLGATLWYLLCGRAPFTGRSPAEPHGQQLYQLLPLEQLIAAKVPAPVVALLRSMLAVNPADRPQSARELLAALRRCRESVAAAPRHRRMFELSALALGLLIASAVGITNYFSHRQYGVTTIVSPEKRVAVPPVNARSIAVSETSMAVLPFKPLLPENRDQVLEMGMADTLITKLSNSREMIVPSLASVRKYGGLDQDPLAAGRKLGVNSILEGNVQKSGDRLRVTVRLIKVADGSSLWAGTFDEKFTDVFTVEDTISQKVAEALALRLSGEEQNRLTKRYTENTTAYQLYLMGRYQWNKLTPPDITKSIGLFQQAIEADPGYALAYFGLAEVYRSLSISGDRPPREVFPLAKAAATKAVQIDELLAEPHASLAFIHMWFDWDWLGAEREARRAIALNPNSAFAHYAYAVLLSNLGRHQEAIAEGARARELEPVSLLTNNLEGAALYYAGRNDEARERLQKTVELDPNFWIAHLYLGHVYLEKKNYPEALAEFTKARDFSRGNSQTVSMIGYVSALAGDATKARAMLDELKSRSAHQYVPRYNIAVVHLALAEQDEAFAWLEKAYEEHDVLVSFLKVDPKWDPVRSDPRFISILERVGLH
jgi:serine/threonine-protein kinase